MPQTVAFTLNGRAVNVTAPHDDTPLLDVLRNQLRLTGTRFGCGLEQCGCCIVLIDGKPVKSCGRAIASLAGRSVTTVEGLGTPEKPHPLQQAFLEEQSGPMRLLSQRHSHFGQGAARPRSIAIEGGNRPRA
jgi:nicotinate dehydrogenase subunit A